MSSPSAAASSTTSGSAKAPPKSTPPKSLTVVLRLNSDKLRAFPYTETESPSSPSSSTAANGTADGAADGTASTSEPNGLLAPPDGGKRKGVPGPKPGMKRSASQLAVDGLPKPRGKPGPKKKIRVDGVNGTAVPVSAPKLNPKANQGAINANLRALDRTGKPCRRWRQTGFQVKSFTGVLWSSNAWCSNKRQLSDPSSDANLKSGSSVASDAIKPTAENSALPSEKSNSGGDGETPLPTIIEPINSSAVMVA